LPPTVIGADTLTSAAEARTGTTAVPAAADPPVSAAG
jgi:hypothetical protein